MKRLSLILGLMFLFCVSFVIGQTGEVPADPAWVGILGWVSSVAVLLIGHFAIPSKWFSILKYVEIALKWAYELVVAVNKTNNNSKKK